MGQASSNNCDYDPIFFKKPSEKTNSQPKMQKITTSVPNSDGARISRLAPKKKLIKTIYEDTKTVVDAVERGCRLSGDGLCVGWRSSKTAYSWLTYSEFMNRAKYFGSGLIHIGLNLGQETQIGIYAKNSVEWVISMYGCLYYSSPIVSLYDSLGPDACSYIINNGDLRCLVCEDEQKVKTILEQSDEIPCLEIIICIGDLNDSVKILGEEKDVTVYSFDTILNLGKMNPSSIKRPQPSDVLEICYTSGTTGNPKGAVITHENWIAAISAFILEAGTVTPNKTDVSISYLPLAHAFEKAIELLMFMVGGRVGFYSGDVNLLIDDMKVLKPTLWPAVPRLLNKFYDMTQKRLIKGKSDKDMKNGSNNDSTTVPQPGISESLGGNIRCIVSSAAPISDVVLRFYRQALGCHVIEVFGQTETSGPCTMNIVSEKSFGHVGSPIASNMVKLIDVPELGYFKKNGSGELCVKGFNVMKCYYKDPETTSEAIDKDGWLHTGEVAMWTENGCIKIIDRIKHILKLSQGEYVSPGKLENIYLQSYYISQIYVHGDSFQSYLVAIVIPDQDVVIPWCKENLQIFSWEEACREPLVNKLILEDMKKLADKAHLMSFEQVKKIHLHSKPLSLEDKHLTPTLKTKRTVCADFFAQEIETLYSNFN